MILPRLNGISPLAIVPRGYFPYPTVTSLIRSLLQANLLPN